MNFAKEEIKNRKQLANEIGSHIRQILVNKGSFLLHARNSCAAQRKNTRRCNLIEFSGALDERGIWLQSEQQERKILAIVMNGSRPIDDGNITNGLESESGRLVHHLDQQPPDLDTSGRENSTITGLAIESSSPTIGPEQFSSDFFQNFQKLFI